MNLTLRRSKLKAIVREIQVGGVWNCVSLDHATARYQRMIIFDEPIKTKMNFTIELPNGETKQITIRDEDDQTIAYGDLGELPSMIETYKEE